MTIKANIIFILFIPICFSFDLPKDKCQYDLKINKNKYNVTHTYHVGDVTPTDAHYDEYGNLFYVESGNNENGYYFNVKIIQINTNIPQDIPGLPEGRGYSIAVDKKNKNVLFGTGRGMYSYNYDSHIATPISDEKLKLDMIFVDKDSNKYITENNNGIHELYLINGEKKIRYSTLEALNEMAIDDKNNIYYIKDEKLYVLKSSLSTPTLIGNVSYDGMGQISFNNDNIYIASDQLVYFHENETGKLKLVENIPGNVTAITFDANNNFILGIYGKILKYQKNECVNKNNDVKKIIDKKNVQ